MASQSTVGAGRNGWRMLSFRPHPLRPLARPFLPGAPASLPALLDAAWKAALPGQARFGVGEDAHHARVVAGLFAQALKATWATHASPIGPRKAARCMGAACVMVQRPVRCRRRGVPWWCGRWYWIVENRTIVPPPGALPRDLHRNNLGRRRIGSPNAPVPESHRHGTCGSRRPQPLRHAAGLLGVGRLRASRALTSAMPAGSPQEWR